MKRRDFLAQSGLLLSGLPVAEAFKTDLLIKLARGILPEASADAALAPRRMLEICFREGLPMIQFAASKEFAALNAPKYANFPYGKADVIQGTNTPTMFFNPNSAPLAKYAESVAITQNIESDGGHTDLFNVRKGTTMMNLVSPVISLANMNPTSSLVTGVQWPGPVSNSLAGQANLVQLTGKQDFLNLFKTSRLRLTNPDLGIILSAAQQISRTQASIIEDKLRNAVNTSGSHSRAVDLAGGMIPGGGSISSSLTDNSDIQKYDGLSSLYDPPHPPGCCSPTLYHYPMVREAFALSLKGFKYNLINSALVTIDLGDWHPLQDTTGVTPITKAIAQTLADTVEYLKMTPDPASSTGLTLWDTTVIVATSEFTRGISPLGMDNNDGDTQGLMIIGKNVKGGFYGSFDLTVSGNGVAHGFDPATGVSTSSTPKNTTLQVYNTVRRLAGLPMSFGEAQLGLTAMLKG